MLGVGADDRVFATSKLFFAVRARQRAPRSRSARARQRYLHPGWADAADGGARWCASYRPTLFFSVPTVYARLLARRPARRHLRARRAPASRRASGCPPRSTARGGRASAWRSSTASAPPRPSSWCSRAVPAEAARARRATPVPGTEARLLDADGAAGGARAQQGVLWVRTPSQAAGLLAAARATRAGPSTGEWFRTGDVYVRGRRRRTRSTAAARTISSRSRGSGWCRPTWRRSLLRHPAVLDGGVVGREEVSGPGQALRLRGAARGARRMPPALAGRAASGWRRERCRARSGRARSSWCQRAAAHGDGQAPALPAAGSGQRSKSRW